MEKKGQMRLSKIVLRSLQVSVSIFACEDIDPSIQSVQKELYCTPVFSKYFARAFP